MDAKPLQFGLKSLFGLTAVVAPVALIARAGNRAAFWGPLLILDDATDDALALVVAGVLILVLVGAIASFPIKPSLGTAVLAGVAVFTWLLLGVLGVAMGS